MSTTKWRNQIMDDAWLHGRDQTSWMRLSRPISRWPEDGLGLVAPVGGSGMGQGFLQRQAVTDYTVSLHSVVRNMATATGKAVMKPTVTRKVQIDSEEELHVEDEWGNWDEPEIHEFTYELTFVVENGRCVQVTDCRIVGDRIADFGGSLVDVPVGEFAKRHERRFWRLYDCDGDFADGWHQAIQDDAQWWEACDA